MALVFVYGTLLNGEYNNLRYLQNPQSTLIGEAVIQGFVMHSLGSFPAIRPVNDISKEIVGEVWEVSDEVFKTLDRLEGYPMFYDRVLVGTSYGEAWVYCQDDCHDSPEIAGGNWRQYLAR